MRHATLAFCVLVLPLVGCGGDTPAASTGKPIIVATIYPLADITRQVVGNAADVVCLVPPGASPHGFEPTAAEAEGLGRAKALVRVGVGFDDWAVRALRKSGDAKAPIIAMAKGEHDDHAHDPAHDDHADHDHSDHDHAHTGPNPHIWLDPVLMAAFAHRLGHELMDLLPDHADAIHDRAEQLEDQLKGLDVEYRTALAAVPAPRVIITFHDAFNVMAERYGVEVGATLMPVDSSNSLTRDRIEKALGVIRKHGVGVVYTEPQFPAEAGQVLRDEAGVKVMVLDPLGDPNVPERATYQLMMRYNLKTLAAGFAARSAAEPAR